MARYLRLVMYIADQSVGKLFSIVIQLLALIIIYVKLIKELRLCQQFLNYE